MDLNQLKKLIHEQMLSVTSLLAKPPLQEMTFNRAKQHIEEEAVEFVMISAFRGGKNQPGNRVRHKEMKSAFKDAGFPFIDMLGGYSEEEHGGATEPSLLVLGYQRPDFGGERVEGLFNLATHLSKRYEQESFIYGAPAKTATGETALKDNPLTGELKPIMDIKAYGPDGRPINEPWAGPWSTMNVAKEDDVYWSVVGGKKGKLVETRNRYEKFIPLKREHAMEKDHYLKSTKSGIKFLEKRLNEDKIS